MRSLRRPFLIVVFSLVAFASLVAPQPTHAVTTFCYTWTGQYIFCRVCEFYGPNGEYLGFIDTCWDRAL